MFLLFLNYRNLCSDKLGVTFLVSVLQILKEQIGILRSEHFTDFIVKNRDEFTL